MSYATFSVALKSTIDFLTKEVADGKSLPFFDFASPEFDMTLVAPEKPAIFWDFTGLDETPFDPLYTASFDVGAMTMLDPSQYISLDIIGAISEKFRVGTSHDIYDYSGDVASNVFEGRFHIVSCGLSPSQQDQSTNVRSVSVVIKVLRNVG
jgi:hypothetical protein